MDEQRIGLKPIVRGVWAPVGQRPIALGHHRFEWLYVTGFVEPASGRTVWNIANAVCKEMLDQFLAAALGRVQSLLPSFAAAGRRVAIQGGCTKNFADPPAVPA
jgi:hypothetical protein